ncbi:SCAN domain-containing protein 3 [Aphis craccivora]|uniref:SCAN domain-containing protein 3 n=1 Tax=Aphis craccivora TaxID=307492 RepID=A0A6G0YMD3_APHCR|nr:SCAN domain-containing protein 3 [Aphis craccivora]
MKIVKSKNRAQLTNIHLENLLKIASFQIQPNIKKNTLLVKNNVNYHTKNKINDF